MVLMAGSLRFEDAGRCFGRLGSLPSIARRHGITRMTSAASCSLSVGGRATTSPLRPDALVPGLPVAGLSRGGMTVLSTVPART